MATPPLGRKDWSRLYDASQTVAAALKSGTGFDSRRIDPFARVQFPTIGELDSVRQLSELSWNGRNGDATVALDNNLSNLAARVLVAAGYTKAGDPLLSKLVPSPAATMPNAGRFAPDASHFVANLLRPEGEPLYLLQHKSQRGLLYEPSTRSYSVKIGDYEVGFQFHGREIYMRLGRTDGRVISVVSKTPRVRVGERKYVQWSTEGGSSYEARVTIPGNTSIYIYSDGPIPAHVLNATAVSSEDPRHTGRQVVKGGKPRTATTGDRGRPPDAGRGVPIARTKPIGASRGEPPTDAEVRPPERGEPQRPEGRGAGEGDIRPETPEGPRGPEGPRRKPRTRRPVP